MPFLRRRGVMASESDMRRHTFFLPSAPTSNPLSHAAGKQPRQSDSIPDLHAESAAAAAAAAAPASAVPSIPAPPATPPNDSPRASSTATMSTDDVLPARPDSPPVQGQTPKHRRFSMLRFRNASDSQLAARAKQQAQAAENAPPVPRPRPPAIITTAPTVDVNVPPKKQSRMKLSARLRRSGELPRAEEEDGRGIPKMSKNDRRRTLFLQTPSSRPAAVSFDQPRRPRTSSNEPGSPEETDGNTLALPPNRMSESSRSERSDPSHLAAAATTKSSALASSNSLFRIPGRKQKQPEPLFPLAHLPQKGNPQRPTALAAGSNSSLVAAAAAPDSYRASTSSMPPGPGAFRTPTASRPGSGDGLEDGGGSTPPPAPSPALAMFHKSNPSPATAALFRSASKNSGRSSPTRGNLNARGRSSTLSSLGRDSVDDHLAAPNLRTSSSAARKSFGDLLGLSWIRQSSEPMSGRQGSLTPATPGSNNSKNNSLQLARESLVLPERRPEESPAKYLARLEEMAGRSVIAAALCKNGDPFSQAVLRSYMRGFSFFGDPMDMAIRKLLMEAELPKETQHIDRCLQAFANRYHECNPGIYSSPDQAYFIAFSLLILHTDVFNKNNRHKMQKADYLKNTRGEGIYDEILDVFYDNITYTPFIRVEDDFDEKGERIPAHKSRKKSLLPNASPDARQASREPIDPYTLIIDGKLDILRPNLREAMPVDDQYNYMGTAKTLNLKELQQTFFRTGVLQIVSARSRPDAFMSEKTAHNPEEAHPGIVDIKITKVGLLWRKGAKKKRTRSPWQEWGVILTGAQLYFFRNVAWVKSLMHQHENHVKHGNDGIPVIFKPPLEQFKPDALMSTDGAVALVDTTYKKHKNAFVYVRRGGFEEILLADNEEEMNDWLAKLNYAAAFRTSGVRMRGVIGSGYDGQSRRAIRRLDSDSAQAVQTPTGDVTITRSQIDHQMAQDILTARREIMRLKVAEADDRLEHEHKKLERQSRNARHLQILAPIQPKTRESMLLSAARMSAQLKWVWMDIWRLTCHRDILLLDLEEERLLLGLPPDPVRHAVVAEKADKPVPVPVPSREEPKAPPTTTTTSQKRPQEPSPQRARAGADRADDRLLPPPPPPPPLLLPEDDVFQAPPTGATDAPTLNIGGEVPPPAEPRQMDSVAADIRKASVASAISSSGQSTASPARQHTASSGSAAEKEPAGEDQHDDVDAGERDLLEAAGLIEAALGRSPGGGESKHAGPSAEPEDGHEWRDRRSSGVQADRSKTIRRSLQRTLREGAGHLSHHRSRKGRESASGTAAAAPATAAGDDSASENTDMLVRGSGSFVVHGKKASVINFGGDLQGMSPDERLRQRKTQQQTEQPAAAGGDDDAASASAGFLEAAGDYHSMLNAAAQGGQKRRESEGSTNTATARSFRELHRKYSSARAAKNALASGASGSSGGLLIPAGDEDSDAAVSFSDGWRSPLPPIETEDVDDDDDAEGREGESGRSDDEDGDEDKLNPEAHRAGLVTPEPPPPPSSPGLRGEEGARGGEDRERAAKGKKRLPSPALQAVSA